MKTPILLTCLALIFLCFTVSAQESDCTPANGEPVRLGAVFPSISLFSADAADPYRGVQAMVAAVNACGGVKGRPIELVYAPANDRDQARSAVEQLRGQVPLIIGSGSAAVSEVLVDAAADGSFVYWEVSEALDTSAGWAFSPRPNNWQLGELAAAFINTDLQTVLDGEPLRLAVLSESHARAQTVTDGLLAGLTVQSVIQHRYTNDLTGGYRLAVEMREQKANVVAVVAFENDANWLWYAMREANANVKAWILIGSDAFHQSNCFCSGDTNGLIVIGATGIVHRDDRLQIVGVVYENYYAAFQRLFTGEPGEKADLSASGVYLLLNDALPKVAGEFTSENIRAALVRSTAAPPAGLLGEGLNLEAGTGLNQAAVAIVHQQQHNQFCTLIPAAVATCAAGLRPFPTWRQRALGLSDGLNIERDVSR